MERQQEENQHEENEKGKAEQKREDMTPDVLDTTKKTAGTTSAFSAATLPEDNTTEKKD